MRVQSNTLSISLSKTHAEKSSMYLQISFENKILINEFEMETKEESWLKNINNHKRSSSSISFKNCEKRIVLLSIFFFLFSKFFSFCFVFDIEKFSIRHAKHIDILHFVQLCQKHIFYVRAIHWKRETERPRVREKQSTKAIQ